MKGGFFYFFYFILPGSLNGKELDFTDPEILEQSQSVTYYPVGILTYWNLRRRETLTLLGTSSSVHFQQVTHDRRLPPFSRRNVNLDLPRRGIVGFTG